MSSPTGYDALRDDPGARVGPAVINPGSGPVPGAEHHHAVDNIETFCKDVGGDVSWAPVPAATPQIGQRKADGRWPFIIKANGRELLVEMPGLPLESVRYMRRPEQNIWHYPRLYVDGSSWAWFYGMEAAQHRLFGEEGE